MATVGTCIVDAAMQSPGAVVDCVDASVVKLGIWWSRDKFGVHVSKESKIDCSFLMKTVYGN